MNPRFVVDKCVLQVFARLMLPLSIGEVAVLGEMLIAEEFEGLWSDLVNT